LYKAAQKTTAYKWILFFIKLLLPLTQDML